MERFQRGCETEAALELRVASFYLGHRVRSWSERGKRMWSVAVEWRLRQTDESRDVRR